MFSESSIGTLIFTVLIDLTVLPSAGSIDSMSSVRDAWEMMVKVSVLASGTVKA